MSETYAWDVIVTTSGETSHECSVEGSKRCISGFIYTCVGGTWVKNSPDESCGGTTTCSGQTTQAGCEAAGCNWYAYPNPFGEAQCFDKPWFIQYLPIIVVGVGAVVLVAALVSSRKTATPMYYPPMYPPYYPPQYGGK